MTLCWEMTQDWVCCLPCFASVGLTAFDCKIFDVTSFIDTDPLGMNHLIPHFYLSPKYKDHRNHELHLLNSGGGLCCVCCYLKFCMKTMKCEKFRPTIIAGMCRGLAKGFQRKGGEPPQTKPNSKPQGSSDTFVIQLHVDSAQELGHYQLQERGREIDMH